VPESPTSPGLRIGDALRSARERRGLTLAEVEAQTKIRGKYLRALEAEDWDVLPSAAYVKGYLRTYARLVGIDADALVDEYRRQVEANLEPPHLLPFGDPVLEGREPLEPLDQRRRWGRPFIAGAALTLLVIALVLAIAGGLGTEQSRHRHHRHGPGAKHAHRGHHAEVAPSGSLTLHLHIINGVQLCLVSASEPLIDAQALAPGAAAGPFSGRRFRLDLDSYGGGAVQARINGHPAKIHSRRRASYFITRRGVSKTSFRGPGCP
jgi:transcriptional regulator with XRE-family HTH domain